MNVYQQIVVFGEVLFDCFPTGEEVLGGAPFNVAWHLQALGAEPLFVSRIGNDEQGRRILAAMENWGMRTDAVQWDENHPTGRVDVTLSDGQPHYHISEGVAYDHISSEQLPADGERMILYHGTLALRHQDSGNALDELAQRPDCDLFIDVNLRAPWWQRQEVLAWLKRARWAKMNRDELAELGFDSPDTETAMMELMTRCDLDQLIVTCGSDGALVMSAPSELVRAAALVPERYVDTVGAGDAFSAVYLQGLLSDRPIAENVAMAQRLAARVIGMRGAIADDTTIYNALSTTG